MLNRHSLDRLQDKKNLIGVEIGVDVGDNALNILQNLDIKRLYLVDPYISILSYGGFQYLPEENIKRKEQAKNLLEDFSEKIVWIYESSSNAINLIEDNLDFIYVDGNHEYKYVRNDLKLFYNKVKTGGLIAGHDYNQCDVKKAVDDFFTVDGIIQNSNPSIYDTEGILDWWHIKKENEMVGKKRIYKPSIIFEQDIVMGTFTHRTTYLNNLLESVKRFLPELPFIIKINDGPINENMELLRQEFLATKKRFWLFLDDDIQFLDSEIIQKAISDLLANKFGMVGVYSTFDSEYKLGIDQLECREVGWTPGYFMLVDSKFLSHIQPDLNLPDPNTSVDTSYCMAVRLAGYRIGISSGVVYHTYKEIKCDYKIIDTTNDYLHKKWGDFYFNHCNCINNIVGKMPGRI